MGNCQGGEAQLSPLDKPGVHTPGAVKNLIKMIRNLFWAAGYNIIAVPLAAGALYYCGIILNPAVGAVLMSLSTVIVALNAQLLKKQIFTG